MFLHNNWKNGWCFLTTVSFFYWLLADRMSFCYTIFERRRSWSFGSWLEFPPRVWLTLPNRRHAEKRAAITKSDNASDFGQKHCYYIPLNLKETATPWCCSSPLMTDFIVVRQPQAHSSCIAFGFFRCPPTVRPSVRHQLSDFTCQPHERNDVRFPSLIIWKILEKRKMLMIKKSRWTSACHPAFLL